MTNGDTMTQEPDYTWMAKRFNDNIGFEQQADTFNQSAYDQFDVAMEEVDEMVDAFYDEDAEACVEEMADVLVTIHVLADRMNVDLPEAYRRKMNYNLHKTGERDENGKVTDDVEMEKPDFGDLI